MRKTLSFFWALVSLAASGCDDGPTVHDDSGVHFDAFAVYHDTCPDAMICTGTCHDKCTIESNDWNAREECKCYYVPGKPEYYSTAICEPVYMSGGQLYGKCMCDILPPERSGIHCSYSN